MTRLFKRLDSTSCSPPLETRSERFYQFSSFTFVCKVCLYLFKDARNLSLYRARLVLYLDVLKFSPTLASRAALSVVPAHDAPTFQPWLSYSLPYKGCINHVETRKQYAKYAPYTRRGDAGTKQH